MALSPSDNETFAREVDDAVREDRVRHLFTHYGRWILAALLVGLLALGGWLYWNHRQEAIAGERGRQLTAVMASLQANRARAASAAAETLATSDDPAYRSAARMLQGGIAESEGNAELAARRFAAVAADADVPRELRDMAILRQTLLEFDTIQPEAIVARLRSMVANADNPLFPAAAELSALAELRRNNNAAASRLYRQIADNEHTPESMKERASQMAVSLRPAAGDAAAAPARPGATARPAAPASAPAPAGAAAAAPARPAPGPATKE